MDSRGWIPIQTLASFKRVWNTTQDYGLVKEVLLLSSIVEVRGEHVRMSENAWKMFVLPGSKPSEVDAELEQFSPGGEEEGEGEEEEEDDVVFVLGPDVQQATRV